MDIGYLEGDICNRDGCKGIIHEHDKEPCTCHLGHPPCSGCVHNYGYCEECGWDAEDETQP